MDKKVMIAGHICLDIAPQFPQNLRGRFDEILIPGKLVNVEDAVLSTGGSVSNTGLAMAKLGVDVLLAGRVGDDAFGTLIKRLAGKKRASSFKTVAGENSSYTIVLALADIDRIFLHNPGTNDTFSADDIDYDLAKDCALFHFGYPPLMKKMYEDGGSQLTEIFKRIKELGVTTSLDMALPDPSSQSGKVDWESILGKVLAFVDIFVPSIEEIAFMLDKDLFYQRKTDAGSSDPVFAYKVSDYTAISAKLLKMGAKIITLKSGVRGIYLRTASADKIKQIGKACPDNIDAWADRELWAASYKAEKFGSATGSGDATIAGFLCGLLRGFTPQDSLKLANTVGWQNVRAIDALTGIENWQNTLNLLKDKNRPCNPVHLDSAGWKYSDEDKVFYGPNDKHL